VLERSHRNIVLEGDSQVIIHLITLLLHGSAPSKISPSWRLSELLEDFKNLLTPALSIVPSHVRREANQVAENLANKAVEKETDYSQWLDEAPNHSDVFLRCQALANNDLLPPDGVPRAHPRTRGRLRGRQLMASTNAIPPLIN